MTFDEIVQGVTERTNLTSSEAITRVGRRVNDRYRRVTASLGIVLSRRTTIQQDTTPGVNTLVFTNCEKIINVVDRSATPYRILKEVTMEELRARQPGSSTIVSNYAIYSVTADTVTIMLDITPSAAFTLYADVYGVAATLSGSQEPAFAESFHDILMHGALADEYRKLQKAQLAVEAEQMYERRLSELRMHNAVSGYKDIVQGKTERIMTGLQAGGSGGTGSGFDGSQSWTQTGLITFDRDPAAPFAVTAGSGKVANLKVEMDFLVVQVFS